jgi:hypothetical protein
MEVGISSTNAEEKDLGNGAFEAVTDDFGEGGTRKFTLVATAADVPLSLGNVAVGRFFAIRTNSKDPTLDPVEITVKRNTVGNEALPVTPMDSTKEGHLLMSTSGLTALFASNPGTVDMEVTLFVSGD